MHKSSTIQPLKLIYRKNIVKNENKKAVIFVTEGIDRRKVNEEDNLKEYAKILAKALPSTYEKMLRVLRI